MRRYDLDWLRVLVFTLLIIYHILIFFASDVWLLSNNISYPWLSYPIFFLHDWRLPILFLISGMGTYYALARRSGITYVKERIVRLLIPLIFGILVIVPPQMYLQKLSDNEVNVNYIEYMYSIFLPNLISTGKPNWNHLWFIAYLLVFSIILAPIFVFLKQRINSKFYKIIENSFKKPYGFMLFLIPIVLSDYFLKPLFPINMVFKIIYPNFIYIIFFFYGFIFISINKTFWQVVLEIRKLLLTTAGVGLCCYLLTKTIDDISFIVPLFQRIYSWSLILAIFGYSAKYLNKSNKILSYANRAVYPFYILHQTITLIIGYFIMNSNYSGISKFMIMTIGTFSGCWIIYEFGIRRWKLMWPFFGLK